MKTNNNFSIEYQYLSTSRDYHKISTNNGLSFTNLVLNTKERCKLKEVLTPNAVHFIYPNKDIHILVKRKKDEHINCKAKNTTLLIDNAKIDNCTTFKYFNNTEVSAFSFSYDFFESTENVGYTKFLNNFFHKKLETFVCLQNGINKDRINNTIEYIKSIDKTKATDQRIIIEAFNELQYIFLKSYLDWQNLKFLSKEELNNIKQLPNLILAHTNSPVLISDLKDELNISEEKINLGTEIVFNCSLRHLINKTKMEQAAKELKNNSSDIAEIVYKNGYKNRGYFYKVFNKIYGCNPMEYIQKNKNFAF